MMAAPARRAVIIGVDNYADPGINDLIGAKNDAEEIYQHLTTFGDFTIEDHHLLMNEKASAQNIRRAISDLLWKTDECELALFYFSGHGLTDAYGNGFIAAYDIDRNCPMVAGIKMQELRDLMLAAKNKKAIVLILDCCYSGIASEGDKAVSVASATAVEACLAPLDDPEHQDTGRFVMTSAGSDERSREKAECIHKLGNRPPHPHGAFTFQILEGLGGRASMKGQITVGSLFECVASSFAVNDQHRPKMYGSGIGSFNIMLCRASRQAELERQLAGVKTRLSGDSDLYELFDAITDLKKVLEDSPGLEEALEARDLINTRLKPHKGPAVKILLSNTLYLRKGCDETFSRLQNTICRPNFDFDTIAQQDGAFQALILTLFVLAAGSIEREVLKTYLENYEAPAGPNMLRSGHDATRAMGS
ncbi:MAG: caspase family protein [Streptosporangiaceae bacterium]